MEELGDSMQQLQAMWLLLFAYAIQVNWISCQGRSNDIIHEIEMQEDTCGHDVHKLQKSRDGLGGNIE